MNQENSALHGIWIPASFDHEKENEWYCQLWDQLILLTFVRKLFTKRGIARSLYYVNARDYWKPIIAKLERRAQLIPLFILCKVQNIQFSFFQTQHFKLSFVHAHVCILKSLSNTPVSACVCISWPDYLNIHTCDGWHSRHKAYNFYHSWTIFKFQ
jgi:hypothetical protein